MSARQWELMLKMTYVDGSNIGIILLLLKYSSRKCKV